MSSIEVAWNPRCAKISIATSRSWLRRCSAGSRICLFPLLAPAAPGRSGHGPAHGVGSRRPARTLPACPVLPTRLQWHLVAVVVVEVPREAVGEVRGLVGGEGEIGRGG